MPKREFSYNEALEKLMTYCSSQERAASDVEKKAANLGVKPELIDDLILALRQNNFISDKRYIEAYVKSKHSYNKWGIVKIKYNLKLKGFSSSTITNYLEDFYSTFDNDSFINNELIKKNNSIKEDDYNKRKAKLIRFAQTRGYDAEVYLSCINKIIE